MCPLPKFVGFVVPSFLLSLQSSRSWEQLSLIMVTIIIITRMTGGRNEQGPPTRWWRWWWRRWSWAETSKDPPIRWWRWWWRWWWWWRRWSWTETSEDPPTLSSRPSKLSWHLTERTVTLSALHTMIHCTLHSCTQILTRDLCTKRYTEHCLIA